MIVKWIGITVVELAYNLVGVHPKNTVQRWDKATTSKNHQQHQQTNCNRL